MIKDIDNAYFLVLAEWPNYSDSDSEVEAHVVSPDASSNPYLPADTSASSSAALPDTSPASPHAPPPQPTDNTAAQIMHLLTELGHSNLVDRNVYMQERFIHCTNCTGHLLIV